LYYVNPEQSFVSGTWKGFPQYYEFDFFRPIVDNQHFPYKSKSAYTYNWMYYLTYPHVNNYKKKLVYYSDLPNGDMDWLAEEGIPFIIENIE
jgi:hypothetical protein